TPLPTCMKVQRATTLGSSGRRADSALGITGNPGGSFATGSEGVAASSVRVGARVAATVAVAVGLMEPDGTPGEFAAPSRIPQPPAAKPTRTTAVPRPSQVKGRRSEC